MALRVAVSGKGGVGKTTIAAILARLLGRDGKKVLAVDVDPSPSLASALGVPKEVRDKTTPISKMLDLIEERTGVKPGSSYGSLFTMNPKVDDLADKFGIATEDNVTLLVLGTIETGASGCFCPENALVKRLVGHLILKRDEALVLDMEAGVEHLGRGTAESVDILIIVIEPGTRSVETAKNIKRLAADIGLKKVVAVLNKSRGEKDEAFARERLEELDIQLLASVPFSDCVVSADLDDVSPMDSEDCNLVVQAILPLKDDLLEFGS